MLAVVDPFYLLVAVCGAAAVTVVVCLIGAVLEALRSDRLASTTTGRTRVPEDENPAEDVDGFTILTPEELARRATPSMVTDEPILLPVAASHRPRATPPPAAPVRVATVEADRASPITTADRVRDPAADARRAVATAFAEARIVDDARRRREAPTSPVPVVRLTPYTRDTAQIRVTLPATPESAAAPVGPAAREAAAATEAPAVRETTSPTGAAIPTDLGAPADRTTDPITTDPITTDPITTDPITTDPITAAHPRRQPTATISVPTAREVAASDVIDLAGERARRTGQTPIVAVEPAATVESAVPVEPAATVESAIGTRERMPADPAGIRATDTPTPTATGGIDHDDEVGRHRRKVRRAGRVRHEDNASTGRKLPAGAEAALRSIIEVRPDPRNTLALQRDPTAEVRLTTAERAEAANLAHSRRSA